MTPRTPAIAVGLLAGLCISTAAKAQSGTRGSGATVQVVTRARVGPDHRETVGMLRLTIPFDTLVGPQDPGRGERLAHKGDGPGVEPAADEDEDEDDSGARDDAAPASEAGAPATPVLREQLSLDSGLVRGAVRRALRRAGHGRAARRLQSLASRARSSALLPRLRLTGGRSTDESLRLSPTTSDPYKYTQSGGTDLYFEARATWRLDRLLFAPEELQVERLALAREKARQALVLRVMTALFSWQRGLLLEADLALPLAQRLKGSLLVLEAEMRLDHLTGGWFTRKIEGSGT